MKKRQHITKIHQGIFEKEHFVIWTHRQIHVCHKLSKFSLSPFALPPPKLLYWCHHCYYLLINRKLYILQKNIYISHLLYTLHHYKPHELHELGCFESIYSAPLHPKPKFQNNGLQSRIYILTQALIICETLTLT